jgi:hypothetical protein
MPPMETRTLAPQTRPDAAEPAGTDLVAETMRRVHDQLRLGRAPSFEALLALGEPTQG